MNTKKLSYLFVVIALILVLAAAIISVAYNTNYAYADYADVVSDPNTILSFNQYVNNNSITHTFSTYDIWYDFSSSLTAGHVFYFRFEISNIGNEASTLFTSTASHSSRQTLIVMNTNGNYSFISAVGYTYLTTYANTAFTIRNFMAIDLTQMFGSGNEPDLSQCEELFIGSYYAYNTGTPFSFGYLNAYNQAVNDLYASSQYALDKSALGLNTYAVEYDGHSSYFYFDTSSNYWFWTNTIGVPLFTTLDVGTTVTIEYSFYPGNLSTYYLQVMLVDEANNYYSIAVDPNHIGDVGTPNTFSFTLPVAASVLYFNVIDSTNNSQVYYNFSSYVDTFNIKASVIDIGALTRNSYSSGYTEAEDYYKSFYGVGGTGYNSIYNAGLNAGLNETNPYTFGYLMTAVIEAPLNAVLSIFNFDFLGYNFKNFITVMLTLCLIIAIVRMFMGGKE